jgi:hypothetical protein
MIKCPHCPRRFEDVFSSRDHVETTHREEGSP